MVAPVKSPKALTSGCEVLRARLVVVSVVTLVLVGVTITADAQIPAPPTTGQAIAVPAVPVSKGAPSAAAIAQPVPVVSTVTPAAVPSAPIGADAIVPPIRRIHPSRVAIEAKSKAKQTGKATPKAKGAPVVAGKTNAPNVVVYSGGKASPPKR